MRPINIVEIIKKVEQGYSEPYLCEAESGVRYYVKGRQSGPETPTKEWICAYLARAFGLPIAGFALVDICSELLAVTPSHLKPIGEGIAFGSKEVPLTCWLESAKIPDVPISIQRDLLVFDWWIRNDDRNRGNINLLWGSESKSLIVIDHNLAFDREFDSHSFAASHPFGAHWDAITSDMMVRLEYQQRLEAILPEYQKAIESIPASWRWLDQEETRQNPIDLSTIQALLERCKTDQFWRAE